MDNGWFYSSESSADDHHQVSDTWGRSVHSDSSAEADRENQVSSWCLSTASVCVTWLEVCTEWQKIWEDVEELYQSWWVEKEKESKRERKREKLLPYVYLLLASVSHDLFHAAQQKILDVSSPVLVEWVRDREWAEKTEWWLSNCFVF